MPILTLARSRPLARVPKGPIQFLLLPSELSQGQKMYKQICQRLKGAGHGGKLEGDWA
jgi:hypothetical protein